MKRHTLFYCTLLAPSLALSNLGEQLNANGLASTESTSSGAQNEAVFSVSSGKTDASFSYSISNDNDLTTFTLKAPLNKDTKESSIFSSINQLNSDFSFSINHKRSFLSDLADSNEMGGSLQHCQDIQDFLQIERGEDTSCEEIEVLEQLSEYEQENGTSEETHQLRENLRNSMQALIGNETLKFWGAQIDLGGSNFKYFETPTLNRDEQIEKDKLDTSITLYGGFMPNDESVLSFEARYEKEFKASQSGSICDNNSTDPVIFCNTGIIGAPKEEEKATYSIEYRSHFSTAALAPKISYEEKSKVTAIAIPIYFFLDKEDHYIGGTRVSWDDKTEDTKITFFVGKRFGILN